MTATTVRMNSGHDIPLLGIGVFLVSDVAVCEASVRTALEAGYRLVDTATLYRNERATGRGIRASGVPRDEVFVTSKVWPSDFPEKKARASIAASVERLDLGPLDLMLLHQPFGDVRGAWRAMEAAVADGAVRSIGVSNFAVRDLERLLEVATIVPAVNQVELHPYHQQRELRAFHERHGIVTEAYYPLGHGSKSLLAEPVFARIGERHGKSAVQVILRWHVQSGIVAIPKSTNPAHIASNLDVFDFALSDAEMDEVAALDRARPLLRIPRGLMELGTPLMPTGRPLP